MRRGAALKYRSNPAAPSIGIGPDVSRQERGSDGSILRQRRLVLFWGARGMSTLSFQMQSVAVGWQIYATTESAFDLGLVGLVQFVPMMLFALLAGQAADRFDRRSIAATCQAIEAVAAATLTIGTAAGWAGREAIFALVAIVGAARAFEMPAMSSLLPTLVKRSILQRAIAGSASVNQAAQISGPALGGLLYAFGPAVAYGTASALFLVASLLALRISPTARLQLREPVSLVSLFSGLGFIRRHRVILGLMSLDLFAVLLGGATALLPIYARDILHTGPLGLGLLRSAPALGALATSLALARRPLRGHVGAALFAALAGFGVATILFGLSTSLPLSFAALAVTGATDMVGVVIRSSVIQLQTPDAMRGRVSAVNAVFISASNRLGDFESGAVAALLGAVSSVVLGGVGTILVALAWTRLFPELPRIETLEG